MYFMIILLAFAFAQSEWRIRSLEEKVAILERRVHTLNDICDI